MCVGRLLKGKRVDVLLQAAALLKKEVPDVSVAIIGDGPERAHLEAVVSKEGIERNVRFFGFLEHDRDVIAIMKASRICIHPSIQEGGSSIISLEANCSGLPVIAVNHKLGISKELIRSGYNGYFVDLTPEDIARQAMVVLRDSGLRETLRTNAIEFSKDFDWEYVASQTEEAYLNCRAAFDGKV